MTAFEEERVATTARLDCLPSRSMVLPTNRISTTTYRSRRRVPARPVERVAVELSGQLISTTGPKSKGGAR